MTVLQSIDAAMSDPDFRRYVSVFDRYSAVQAYLKARFPGHEEKLDYSPMSINEANMYTDIAMNKMLDEALELEAEMI